MMHSLWTIVAALCALGLFAYLVFALIYAEEF